MQSGAVSSEFSTEALQKQNLEPSFDLAIPLLREDLQESKLACSKIPVRLCLCPTHNSQDTAVGVKTRTSKENLVSTHNGIVFSHKET